MKTGIELIAEERERQILVEGWTEFHDDQHKNGELAMAASCYAAPRITLDDVWRDSESYPLRWPWDMKFWKPSKENRIRDLQKAGALIAAEIDRLLRLDRDKK